MYITYFFWFLFPLYIEVEGRWPFSYFKLDVGILLLLLLYVDTL